MTTANEIREYMTPEPYPNTFTHVDIQHAHICHTYRHMLYTSIEILYVSHTYKPTCIFRYPTFALRLAFRNTQYGQQDSASPEVSMD